MNKIQIFSFFVILSFVEFRVGMEVNYFVPRDVNYSGSRIDASKSTQVSLDNMKKEQQRKNYTDLVNAAINNPESAEIGKKNSQNVTNKSNNSLISQKSNSFQLYQAVPSLDLNSINIDSFLPNLLNLNPSSSSVNNFGISSSARDFMKIINKDNPTTGSSASIPQNDEMQAKQNNIKYSDGSQVTIVKQNSDSIATVADSKQPMALQLIVNNSKQVQLQFACQDAAGFLHIFTIDNPYNITPKSFDTLLQALPDNIRSFLPIFLKSQAVQKLLQSVPQQPITSSEVQIPVNETTLTVPQSIQVKKNILPVISVIQETNEPEKQDVDSEKNGRVNNIVGDFNASVSDIKETNTNIDIHIIPESLEKEIETTVEEFNSGFQPENQSTIIEMLQSVKTKIVNFCISMGYSYSSEEEDQIEQAVEETVTEVEQEKNINESTWTEIMNQFMSTVWRIVTLKSLREKFNNSTVTDIESDNQWSQDKKNQVVEV